MKISIFKFLFITALVFVGFSFASQASAATYYWVGNGGNTSTNSNWNTTAAACGTGNKSAAFTTADVLIFTSSCTGNATIDASLSVTTFTMQSGYTGTISANAYLQVAGTLTITSGTLTGSSANMYTGAVTVNGGTFNASTGTHTIYPYGGWANFTVSSGTFNHNGGTVEFYYGSVAANSNITFNNLTLNGFTNASPFYGNSGVSPTVVGTFTVTKGYLTYLTTAGTWNLKGNVVFANNAVGSTALGYMSINGTGAQSVTFNGNSGYGIGNITINNPLATINYNAYTRFTSLTLTSFSGSFDLGTYGIYINESLVHTSGTFNGGSGDIYLRGININGGTFNSTSGTLYTTSYGGNGSFYVSSGTFNHNNGTVYFQYGNMSVYNNVTFNNLTINGTSNTSIFYTGSGISPTVNGTFTLTKGVLSYYTSAGTWNLKGDVVFANNVAGSNSIGYMSINGTGAQSVTFNGNSGYSIGNITINNSLATINYNAYTVFTSLTLTSFPSPLDVGAYGLATTGTFTQSSGTFTSSGPLSFGGLTLSGASTVFNNNSTLSVTGTLSMSNGTFNGGSSSITVRAFSLTGGTFNSTPGTLTISNPSYSSGSFTNTAGTFNHNNGTVAWSTNTGAINAVSTTFYNLTFNCNTASDPFTFTSGNNITVNNTLTITKGSLTASGAATINAKGNVTFGANTNGAHSSNLTIILNGTSSQTLTINTNSSTYYLPAITLNNSLATITYSGYAYFRALTLTAFSGTLDVSTYSIGVQSTLTLASGTFTCGSSMTVGALTITGGTFNSCTNTLTIYTTNNGNARFLYSGGTFNHNNGTVAWSSSTVGCGYINANNQTFYNLTLNSNANNCWWYVYGGTSFTVLNNFNVVKGSFSALSPSSAYTIYAKGNVTFSANAIGTSQAHATININGTNAQTVSFAGNTTYALPAIVLNNSLITATANGSSIFSSLTVTAGTLDFNGYNQTVSGTFTVGSGGTLKRTGAETITTTQPTFSAGSTAYFNGSAASYTLPTTASYSNLVIYPTSGSTVYTTGANSTSTNITISNGTLNQSTHSITVTNTLTVGGAGSFTNTSTGDFYVGSGGVVNDGYINFSNSGILIRSTSNGVQRNWSGSGIFNMNSVDVKDQSATDTITVYGGTNSGNNTNWTFSGAASPIRTWKGVSTATWSTPTNWVENSAPDADTGIAVFNSSYNNPATFDASAVSPMSISMTSGYTSTLTLAKNLSLLGTFSQAGGTFSAGSYTVNTTGATTLSGGTYSAGSGTHTFGGGLTLSGGTFSGGSAVTNVTGNLNITSGTFTASTATTSVSGNFTNTGTFTPGTGLVDLTGTNQTITGTSTFNNLRKVVSTARTLTFGAGQTITITGTTTLSGASGQLLSLRSSSDGTQWIINPAGGRSLAYLDVKDSNNTGSNISAANYTGLTDSGNNTNWTFTFPVITVAATGTQVATTTTPGTDKYLGGAFTLTRNISSGAVTSVRLAQTGSLPTGYITNVELRYKDSSGGLCSNTGSLPVGTTLFGTAGSWSGGAATTTGSMTVGTTPVCLYVLYDLTPEITSQLLFNTINLVINNPSTDVVSSGATVSPSTLVDISGTTMITSQASGLPGISLSVSDSSISTGDESILSWTTTQNPSSCEALGDWSGVKPVTSTGTTTGILNEHRTYTFSLRCLNDVGSSTASVYVVATNPNAPILTISASPSNIASGESSTVTWTLAGGVNTPDSCTAAGGWSGSKSTSGGSQLFSNITSSTGYSLTCGNSYGTTTKSTGVTVSGDTEPAACSNGVLDDGEVTIDSGGICDQSAGTNLQESFGDSMVLEMADPDLNPTIFYFKNTGLNNALYMKQGPAQEEVRLTDEDLDIEEGSFNPIDCIGNDCRGVKILLIIKKAEVFGGITNYAVEKTFRASAISRKKAE